MREQGSIIAHETGQVTAYALDSAQDKGTMFIRPGDQVRFTCVCVCVCALCALCSFELQHSTKFVAVCALCALCSLESRNLVASCLCSAQRLCGCDIWRCHISAAN